MIEPFLPVAATGPLPGRVGDQFNGILWRFRTGAGWRGARSRHSSIRGAAMRRDDTGHAVS
ncbi:hypothetical protein GT755_15825 [Herbidospora sp. NEAU-GS84]|uniref:Transposase n=1 Tax=Herbidospora solisilvae TaxID=2696284 RepID=A0A7C9NNS7_9ACTN|nr:hypothetical protein [Herbidospora solisilvae]